MTGQVISPGEGREHFACPECGRTAWLVLGHIPETPWCAHDPWGYDFPPPELRSAERDRWVQMVPVTVTRREEP